MSGPITAEDAKKWLNRCFSCSEAMTTLLNRAAGGTLEDVEQAAGPLAGGLLGEGHACGMLWGVALAAGIRAADRFESPAARQAAGLHATRTTLDEHVEDGNPVDCSEITGFPRWTRWTLFRYALSEKPKVCEAYMAAWGRRFHETIDRALDTFDGEACGGEPLRNCACEAMRRVGEVIEFEVEGYATIPSGLAGGLGLRGNACGALGAAILTQCLQHYTRSEAPRDSMLRSVLQEVTGIGAGYRKPSERLLQSFQDRYGALTCAEITGRRFESLQDHAEFLESGGCGELLEALADWARAAR
jgi:hypothetical protein